MNTYFKTNNWKIILFAVAIIIVTTSLWYSNIFAHKVAKEERKNIEIWADAVHRKASLVKYTEDFFEKIKIEERKRVKLLAETYERVNKENNSNALTFYLKIISNNTTIPVILTDDKGNITECSNVDFDEDTVKVLKGELKKEFSVFRPIKINYYAGKKFYLYYKESKLYSELRDVLNDLVQSFFSEVVINSASVPVIITDSTKNKIITYGNIKSEKFNNLKYRKKIFSEMVSENLPIEIDISGLGKRYIFYKNSTLLTELRYYPYIQFGIIGIFLFIAYTLFSTSRKSEQNQVWAGLAKETAHQLGTPLSSLMAWVEILKLKNVDDETVKEISKDVHRLDTITKRFSKIGSIPILKNENIVGVIYESITYLKTRTSKKIKFFVNKSENQNIIIPVNLHLFEWVIENICKNAIDAMSGVGIINFNISEDDKRVFIDISDTGKGLSRRDYKKIFNPGITTKKRGWGLGLSLTKRIIEEYHSGKIFVKNSTPGKGTTFRIILKKS